jgi:hypothetical protein
MDLKDLKSAWNSYSSQEMDRHRLGKESINELLKNRTQTLVDRIDRNLRIGMGVLGLYISYLAIDYLILSPLFSKIIIQEKLEYPEWLKPLDIFSTVVIVATYLFFVFRYLKIKKSYSIDLQLKHLLVGIQKTLKTYQIMFYLAIAILFVNILVSYTAGVYQGIKFKTNEIGGDVLNITAGKILLIIGVSLLIIIPLIALVFFILRWGFNKLYGQYLNKLNETLQELEESEIAE